jgi:hypothetical protein
MTDRPRWTADGLYILGGSVVGTVSTTALGDYIAYGCMSDWQDTQLGTRANRMEARELVQAWVKEQR